MKPYLLALQSSPRLHGSDAALLSVFCRTIKYIKIVKVVLNHLSVFPCLGCVACNKKFICRQSDDFAPLVTLLNNAAAVVVASPVYFYGFPGQTKNIIDRCQLLWHNPYWKSRLKRPGFFISTCASRHYSEFEVIRHEAKAFFNTIALEYSGEFLVSGLSAPNIQTKLHTAKKRLVRIARHFQKTKL
jgi:multimeric flavodoxin WrbA